MFGYDLKPACRRTDRDPGYPGVPFKEAPVLEIHIAAPKTNDKAMDLMIARLKVAGFGKVKYFYQVKDIRPADMSCHPAGTPPTGHDLVDPAIMATTKVRTYAEARELILDGMGILADAGVKGNFEIEAIVGGPRSEVHPPVNVEADFPNHRTVMDAPKAECHVVWKAPLYLLPRFEEIVSFFETHLGTTPHQIVDFGHDAVEKFTTNVSRVATVYQPSVEAVIRFNERLRGLSETLGLRYAVGEQVLAVGEAC